MGGSDSRLLGETVLGRTVCGIVGLAGLGAIDGDNTY